MNITKKLVIGGLATLVLAARISENRITVIDHDSSKNIFSQKQDMPLQITDVLPAQDQQTLYSLEKLSIRLAKDLAGYDITREDILNYYSDKRFRVHKSIGNFFLINPELSVAKKQKTVGQYKQNIGFKDKISRGKRFISENLIDLLDAENEFGPSIYTIAATIGMESDYSINPGWYYAFNAGVSLCLTFKKDFAYPQLKELIILSKKKNIPIYSICSSYAICSGPGQFLISNINNIFEGDIFVMKDWIRSVAKYLKLAGWDKSQNDSSQAKGSANWKAMYNYNNSDAYVQTIFDIAREIRKECLSEIRSQVLKQVRAKQYE